MKKVGWLPTFIKEDMTRLLSNQLYKYICHIVITFAVFTYLIGGKDSGGIKTGYLTAG